MRLPDLASYQLHKIIEDVDLEGVAVPGLRGVFYRRQRGARVHTVGLYTYGGAELFMAWGYVGEAHCRYTAYRRSGGWSAPAPGCPAIRTRPGAVVLGTGARDVVLPTGGAPLPAAFTTGSGSGRPACPVVAGGGAPTDSPGAAGWPNQAADQVS